MTTAEPTAGPLGARLRAALQERISYAVSEFAAAAALVVLFIALSIASPVFLSIDNLFQIAAQTTVVAIVAIAQTMIIITAGIDLSVGSVAALSGVVGAMAIRDMGVPLLLAVVIAIGVGTVAGLVNGLLTTVARMNPFIATLGMMSVARGTVYIVSGAVGVYGLPKAFQLLGNGQVYGFPLPVLILLVVAVGVAFLLSQTRFGSYLYAIGSNREAARRAGIAVRRRVTSVYALAGGLVGLAGIIAASRASSGQPNFGIGLELDVIAAAVIGGASLFGGQGRVVGTLIGAFLVALVHNGAVLLGINTFYQQVIIGLIIWAAVYFDQFRRRRLEARE